MAKKTLADYLKNIEDINDIKGLMNMEIPEGPGVLPFSILCLTLHDVPKTKSGNIPRWLFFVPLFEDGNLKLIPLSFSWFAQPLGWAVQHAMVTSTKDSQNKFQLGISILLRGQKENLLTLNYTTYNVTEPTRGNWSSSPNADGKFSLFSLPIYIPNYSSAPFSWTFLLAPSPNSSKLELPTTIAFNFVLKATDKKFKLEQQGDSFPSKWNADYCEWSNQGLTLTISRETGEEYVLSTGAFSGGLGHLVCQGTWGPDKMQAPGDGTWTGTSGGPISVPPSQPTGTSDTKNIKTNITDGRQNSHT